MLINPSFEIESIEKEINNVNSEIVMRMTHNRELTYYKLLKEFLNPLSKVGNDGFDLINKSND